jgi:hypothetical protein
MKQLFPAAADKLVEWKFTGDFGRSFERLMSLQMWCFGRDIKYCKQNLLLEYGFRRTRPEAGRYGSSQYVKLLESGDAVTLWGFAAQILSASLGLCIHRHQRTPRCFSAQEVSSVLSLPHDLPSGRLPANAVEQREATRLLSAFAHELAQYEEFVESTAGVKYRELCLSSQREHRLLGTDSLRDAWTQLDRLVH